MRQIPSPSGCGKEEARVLDAVKENVEQLRGVRGGKIQPLPATATTTDIINKINELISRLQD